MKKEVLRLQNISIEQSSVHKAVDINLCLMQGESVGFLGLAQSGKDLLPEVLSGVRKPDRGFIYMAYNRLLDLHKMSEVVYQIKEANYLIGDWTVAEYISLVAHTSHLGFYKQNSLLQETLVLMRDVKLNIDPGRKLKQLTELEKRQVDLVKAYSKSAKIVIIEDDFEGCTAQDIAVFKGTLDLVTAGRMAAVINSYSDTVSFILSDRYVIFKKGYIVKKCNKKFINNRLDLEKYMLGTTIIHKKHFLDSCTYERQGTKETIYSVGPLMLHQGHPIYLAFDKGEVVSILAVDTKEKERIFNYLSGRIIDKQMAIYLENKRCNYDNVIDFVQHKVVSVGHMGSREELLTGMSVGENLLIPSLKKISPLRYTVSEHSLVKVLEEQISENLAVSGAAVKDMGINDYIVLILERWYILRPRVLILYEPFVNCDIYGVSLVQSYIRKFSTMGTAVVIVKSREEYLEELSDRIINIPY